MFLYQCLEQIIAFLIKIKNINWIVEWTRLENTRALDLGGGDFGIPIFFSSGYRTHYEGLFRSSMVYFQIRFSCQLSEKLALDWGWWLRFFALKLIDINAYWYCTLKKNSWLRNVRLFWYIMIYIHKSLCYCLSLFFFYKMVIVLLDIFSCGFEKNYHFHLTVLTGN